MTDAAKRTVHDADVAGKTVLVRVDYNVPFRPGTAEISDDSRIAASLPTVRYLLERRCRVILCSHLGRPGGEVVEEMRLEPVAVRLGELLGRRVEYAPDCVGPEVERAAGELRPGGVLLLENLRFHAGEEQNDADFSRRLASLADLFVNDAFGAAHRAHASTVGVAEHLPAVAGLLMARELEMLGAALESPARPFAAVFGGAKVSDKLAVLLRRMAPDVDTLMVGGGMAATFLKARGLDVGTSLVEEEWVPAARELLGRSDILLPVDVVVSDGFSETASHRVVDAASIPAGWCIMDIGPETSAAFEAALAAREDGGLERHNGRRRVASVRGRDGEGGQPHRRPEGRDDRDRRRLDGRGGPGAGARRPHDPRVDRRRRGAGVPGGQGAARRRRVGRQDARRGVTVSSIFGSVR